MMHTIRLRWVGVFLTFSILLSLLILPTAALTPAYPITGAYLTSTYHNNLLNIPRTGDKAFDTVAVAMTQVGYHEGNSTADFDGENISGYKNYTEYNRAFGTVDGTYGYAWCAAFVSWCLEEANATNAAGGLFVSCTLWVERLQAIGQYSTRASGYRPKAGDLIFFRSSGAGRTSDHIGIVRYVSGGHVYTVEGNSSDKVSLNSYTLTNTYIIGYGKPDYGSFSLNTTAFACEDRVIGWYSVTNDFVHVRTGASTTATKSGKLYLGDMVRITEIKNGWGAFEQEGKTRYISLDYADFVSPIAHRVKYDGAGGENVPENASYYSMQKRYVSATVPTREGYTFEGWESTDGTRYTAGDALPVAGLTLTAVWEPIPVAEPPAKEPAAPEDPPVDTPEDIPEVPGEDERSSTEDVGEDYLAPGGEDAALGTLPEADLNGVPSIEDRAFTAPDIATAVFFGLAALGGTGWYIWRKKRRT